jgi:hypothetical protein
MYIVLIAIIWIILGIHSAWFLIKRITIYADFTTNQIPMLVFCVLIPIISHIATLATYPRKKDGKVLFRKQA